MARISVEIRNFQSYKGRADVGHNSWFRCSNRLLEDPDFFEFTHEEFLVWIYILSVASQKNSGKIEVNTAHAERISRLSENAFLSAVQKLKNINIIEFDVTDTLRARNVDERDSTSNFQVPCATLHNKTIQNITEQNKTQNNSKELFSPELEKPTREVKKLECIPQFLEFKSFIDGKVLSSTQESWLKLYSGEMEFFRREFLKMQTWVETNPRKARKTRRGWTTFIGGWLERGWDRYAKTIQSKPSGDSWMEEWKNEGKPKLEVVGESS